MATVRAFLAFLLMKCRVISDARAPSVATLHAAVSNSAGGGAVSGKKSHSVSVSSPGDVGYARFHGGAFSPPPGVGCAGFHGGYWQDNAFAGLGLRMLSTADNKDDGEEPIEPFVCEPCKKKNEHWAFQSRDALYNHIKRYHEPTLKKGHMCHRCFNCFETKQQLDAHICPMKGFNTPDELLKALFDAKLIKEQKAFDEKVAAMTKEQASEAINEAWKVFEKAGLAVDEARKAKEIADNPTAVDEADKAWEKAVMDMDNAYKAYDKLVKALDKLYKKEKAQAKKDE